MSSSLVFLRIFRRSSLSRMVPAVAGIVVCEKVWEAGPAACSGRWEMWLVQSIHAASSFGGDDRSIIISLSAVLFPKSIRSGRTEFTIELRRDVAKQTTFTVTQ